MDNICIGIIVLWIFHFHTTLACCPSWATGGSYNPATGKCYLVSDYLANWTDSSTACQSLGAVLGIADTVEDTNFVSAIRSGPIWIGVNDLDTEGVFTYNGYNLTDTLWKVNQPNGQSYEDGQDCAVMDVNEEWQDKRCSDTYHFLCEWPVVKDHSADPLKFIKSSDTLLCDQETMPPGTMPVKDLLFCAMLCHRQIGCVKFAFYSTTSSDNCILYSYRFSFLVKLPNGFQLYTLL